ncbi:GNAT family N-acetyltransferase [Candidatus Roizmanbacteria bacterium]|nr:GNAT family N-acetyltransferase [Candidatus Roizmanbacteria bacterium]
MEIVPYEIKDSTSVTAFFREIFDEMGWKERVSDHMDQPHLLFHLPQEGLLLLVKKDNKIIGTAGIIFLTKTDGLIKRFYIGQQYRGTGIAQLLLDELEKKAKIQGLTQLILDVSKGNTRAIRFYEKSGFSKTEVIPQEGWLESCKPETHYYFMKRLLRK